MPFHLRSLPSMWNSHGWQQNFFFFRRSNIGLWRRAQWWSRMIGVVNTQCNNWNWPTINPANAEIPNHKIKERTLVILLSLSNHTGTYSLPQTTTNLRWQTFLHLLTWSHFCLRFPSLPRILALESKANRIFLLLFTSDKYSVRSTLSPCEKQDIHNNHNKKKDEVNGLEFNIDRTEKGTDLDPKPQWNCWRQEVNKWEVER